VQNRDTKNAVKLFGKNVNCIFYGKAGHFANRCFLKLRREKQSVRYFSVKLHDEFCTEFTIQAMKVNCLIDTGAECSLISSRVAEKLACHLEPDFTMLRGIGGTLVPTLYKTTLRIEREGTKFMINFYVVEHSLLKLDAILD
jgi:predicted aspartyl protease